MKIKMFVLPIILLINSCDRKNSYSTMLSKSSVSESKSNSPGGGQIRKLSINSIRGSNDGSFTLQVAGENLDLTQNAHLVVVDNPSQTIELEKIREPEATQTQSFFKVKNTSQLTSLANKLVTLVISTAYGEEVNSPENGWVLQGPSGQNGAQGSPGEAGGEGPQGPAGARGQNGKSIVIVKDDDNKPEKICVEGNLNDCILISDLKGEPGESSKGAFKWVNVDGVPNMWGTTRLMNGNTPTKICEKEGYSFPTGACRFLSYVTGVSVEGSTVSNNVASSTNAIRLRDFGFDFIENGP